MTLNIFVAGHNGLVGSALCRQLEINDNVNLITAARTDVDLTNQADVNHFFQLNKIDQVYLAAAKVGGIYANNTYPAEFIYQNLMIEANIINSAFEARVKKLLFLGSNCIYPKITSQPIKEEALLTGELEPTNEPYAIAKIAGIKLCESYNRQYRDSHGIDYRSVMPVNLYGPGDNYHSDNAHVLPALLRRFHEAKTLKLDSVTVWGTGTPRREFLYVDDMASACIYVMNLERSLYDKYTSPMKSHINVGYGSDVTINKLAQLIAETVGFSGLIHYDTSMPDGTPSKLLDNTLLKNLGWSPRFDLQEGLKLTYENFLDSEMRQ